MLGLIQLYITIYNYMFNMNDIISLLKSTGFVYMELRDGYSDRVINADEVENVERVLFLVGKQSNIQDKKIRLSQVKRH